MSLLDIFKKQQQHSTAAIAKERLQILVAHERSTRNGPDYLPALQKDIMEVVQRYVNINSSDIQINLDHAAEYSILELNVTLPEQESASSGL